MKFRPCIDIHNGKVKQIVGGSLRDQGDQAEENFAADQGADYFAEMYKKDGLKGGHVILLNPASSEYYGQTKKQALKALHAYPGGLQIGGGITADNASGYIRAGASHVIVTSYVFKNGEIYWDNLKKLCMAGILCAVAVVGSTLSVPVFGSKCAPVQHMVNVLLIHSYR